MEAVRTLDAGGKVARALWGVLLVEWCAAGVFVLLFFWNEVLNAEDFASLSLPLVAVVAGVASTFNPCSLPALPGFVVATGAAGAEPGPGRRARTSAAAALGASGVVVALGLVVAVAGDRTKNLIEPHFRWVQLVVGVVLVGLAGLHLAGRTSSLPAIGRVTGLGGRAWDAAVGKSGVRSSVAWGAGFVAIGAG